MGTAIEVRQRSIFKLYTQWVACLCVFMIHLQLGISNGWTAPNVAKLMGPDSPIPLTEDQAKWLSAFTGFGPFLGSCISSNFHKKFSNEKIIFFGLLFCSVSWLLLSVTNSIGVLFAARLISCAATSPIFSCFSLFYLSEVCSAEFRGTFVSVSSIGLAAGVVISSVLELYLPVLLSSLIYFLSSLIAIVLLLWLVESPYSSVKNHNLDLASNAIAFFDHKCDADYELEDIRNYIELNSDCSLKTPAVRKSAILYVILLALPAFSGMPVIDTFMAKILTVNDKVIIDPKYFVIYFYAASAISSSLSVNLIDKFGRKTVLMSSCIGSSVAMALLGISYLLFDTGVIANSFEWLLPMILIKFSFVYSIGLVTVPNTVLSEIFPDNMKNFAACISPAIPTLSSMIVTKIYPPMVDGVGEYFAFLLYGLLSLLSIPTAMYLMTETKGKSLLEIQRDLSGVRKTRF